MRLDNRRPGVRVIPEWFGGGTLPRKELHELATVAATGRTYPATVVGSGSSNSPQAQAQQEEQQQQNGGGSGSSPACYTSNADLTVPSVIAPVSSGTRPPALLTPSTSPVPTWPGSATRP